MTLYTSLQESTPPVETLTTSELACRLSVETRRYLTQGTSNEAYGIELFRRAFTGEDDAAWSYIYQQFQPLVLAWIIQHRAATPILKMDGPEGLVQASFTKFWQSLRSGKGEHFDSMACLLKYFKLTVHSVVTDAVRFYQMHNDEEALELLDIDAELIVEETPEDTVVAHSSAQSFWQTIQAELNNDDERLIISLSYGYNMQPYEICKAYRHRFPTSNDVYRIKRNVLDRLRRNHRVRKILVDRA